jgi:hypothetical protein
MKCFLRDDEKAPFTGHRTLRRQVEDTGATIHLQGSQWILCGRKTEPLGYSIKTERDALEFALDRARDRERDYQDSRG